MSTKTFSQEVAKLSIAERILKAKETTEALTYKVLDVIELHEANKIIVYSDRLASQIPKSHAANAFTTFQNTMFNYEVIKCIALWDRADDNVISIPTVIELIDDAEVLDSLINETRSAHLSLEPRILNPSEDPEIQAAVSEAVLRSQEEFSASQAGKAHAGLVGALSMAKEIIQRERTTSIKNLRDHLAHNLIVTRAEQRGSIPNMKYGDEKNLLDISIRLVEDLYCWVNGTSFDIRTDCVELAKRRAEELWLNCRFDI